MTFNPIALSVCLVTLLCVSAIADEKPDQLTTEKSKNFRDEHVSFSVPDGATVKPIPEEDIYMIFKFGSIGQHSIWFQYASMDIIGHPSKALSFLESLSFNNGESGPRD